MRGCVVLVLLRVFMSILVTIPEPTGILLFHVFLQFPFSYEFFYLLLQIPAILCVMPVIFVKAAIFPLIMHIG